MSEKKCRDASNEDVYAAYLAARSRGSPTYTSSGITISLAEYCAAAIGVYHWQRGALSEPLSAGELLRRVATHCSGCRSGVALHCSGPHPEQDQDLSPTPPDPGAAPQDLSTPGEWVALTREGIAGLKDRCRTYRASANVLPDPGLGYDAQVDWWADDFREVVNARALTPKGAAAIREEVMVAKVRAKAAAEAPQADLGPTPPDPG